MYKIQNINKVLTVDISTVVAESTIDDALLLF